MYPATLRYAQPPGSVPNEGVPVLSLPYRLRYHRHSPGLTQEDVDLIKTTIDAERIESTWIGEPRAGT